MKPQIYTASKVFRAPMWRALRIDYPDLEFTSRWINEDISPLVDADETACREGWIKNIQDVNKSSHLICYAEKDDLLSGTLVEIGAALACESTPVYLIGTYDWKTWRHHPMIRKVNILHPLNPQYQVAVVLDRIARGD